MAVLICAALSGCTRDEPDPVDTTSTSYMFDNIFNPCRQMPQQFLDNHLLKKEPKGINNLIEGYVSLGCSYTGPEYDFVIEVSNSPLGVIPSGDPHRYQETRIAGRAAKILSLPLEQRFCVLRVEMTGGTMSLAVARKVALDPCPTLKALAEELLPQLSAGV
ncbi:DUF3558 family protein [Nocardia gipuzkoensis]